MRRDPRFVGLLLRDLLPLLSGTNGSAGRLPPGGTLSLRKPTGRNPSRDAAGPGTDPAPDKGATAMAYGHAERTLATIRLLEAETRELLSRQKYLEPEHAEWLRQAAESASRRLHSGSAAGTRTAHDQAGVRLSRRVEPRPVRLGPSGPRLSRSAQPARPAAALPCPFLPVEPAPDSVLHRVPERVVMTLRAYRAPGRRQREVAGLVRLAGHQGLDRGHDLGQAGFGVGEEHAGLRVGVQLVVDPGVAVAHRPLDHDHALGLVNVQDRHA